MIDTKAQNATQLDELRTSIPRIFEEISKVPGVYPDAIAMVRELGIQIEDVNFNLGYEELIKDLKAKYNVDFGTQNLIIITSRNGYLDVCDLFTESEKDAKDYSEIQANVLSGNVEVYIIGIDEWKSIGTIIKEDMYSSPVEDRIRKFRDVNSGYNYYSNSETEYLRQFASGEVGLKITRREYLESMMGWLDEKVYFGEFLNYRYLVDGILAHAEKLEVEQ